MGCGGGLLGTKLPDQSQCSPHFYDTLSVDYILIVLRCVPLAVQAHVAHNCKRLTVELMHYIIESRSLRKVRVEDQGRNSLLMFHCAISPLYTINSCLLTSLYTVNSCLFTFLYTVNSCLFTSLYTVNSYLFTLCIQ